MTSLTGTTIEMLRGNDRGCHAAPTKGLYRFQ